MKRIVYYGIQDIRLEEAEIPTPGPGEVVVKNKVTLTCGTDRIVKCLCEDIVISRRI